MLIYWISTNAHAIDWCGAKFFDKLAVLGTDFTEFSYIIILKSNLPIKRI